METIKVIEELITRSGKTANAVLTDCKLSHNSLTAWKSGKAKPSIDAITKLADYFGVTIDFIVGREQTPMPTGDEIVLKKISEDEKKLINTYRGMSLFNKLTLKLFIVTNPLMWGKKKVKGDLITKDEIETLKKMQGEKE